MADSPALDLYWRSGADVPSVCELVHAALDDFEPQAILEHESNTGWRVHFRASHQRDAAAAALQASLGRNLSSIASVDVPDEGWARRSQADLKAVRVGRIVVAPPWDPAAEHHATAPGEIVIVIEPSTGFGTGHHETTRLCLGFLQAVDLNGRRAIDVGTGSGILALASWKLGASSILAFDEDHEALDNARENLARNRASAIIELRQAALGSALFDPADVVVANLTAAALRKHARDLGRLTRHAGTLIVSGFSPAELRDVSQAFPHEVDRHTVDDFGEWAAVSFRISHPPAQT